MKYSLLLSLFVVFVTACQPEAVHKLYKEKGPIISEKPIEANFVSIRDHIFNKSCNECHRLGGKAKDILLDYDSLMNSPRELVLAGNSEESGLYISVVRKDKKVMPPLEEGYSLLTNEEIEAIKTWIDSGAKK